MSGLFQQMRLATIALIGAALISDIASAAEVEAYAGLPFGVGRVTLAVASAGPAAPLEDERFTVASPDGRVL